MEETLDLPNWESVRPVLVIFLSPFQIEPELGKWLGVQYEQVNFCVKLILQMSTVLRTYTSAAKPCSGQATKSNMADVLTCLIFS